MFWNSNFPPPVMAGTRLSRTQRRQPQNFMIFQYFLREKRERTILALESREGEGKMERRRLSTSQTSVAFAIVHDKSA